MESQENEPKPSPESNRPPRRVDEPQRGLPFTPLSLLIFMLVIWAVWSLANNMVAGVTVDFSFFRDQLAQGNVAEVTNTGLQLEGKWKSVPTDPAEPGRKLGDKFTTYMPIWADEDVEFRNLLAKQNVKVSAERADMGTGAQVFLWLLPLLIVGGFLFFMMRRSDPMGSGFLGGFGRSGAKRFLPSDKHNTFKDVAAMDQAKSELVEIVEFLKAPERFQLMGAQIPKGVLLIGPPGTGKTLMARAVAGEAGVPFFSINGSEFIQMFVGVGASRVRDLFQQAREQSPCIIFIDEIDAVGRHRGAGLGGGHDEREQTLNQILSEMDGFEQTNSIIVLAATNRPDVLDPALLRPGRFDRHVTIDRPTREGRLAILKVHSRKVPLDADVNLDDIAVSTPGFSGAELKNLVNEAALLAVRSDRKAVTMEDFETAKDRVMMGPKREEVLKAKERRMTACHEAGHALVGWFQADAEAVHKVTIIPRGRALGVTWFQHDEERLHTGEKRCHAYLATTLAGRAAEKIVFDEFSAGAENDLKQATRMARSMVAHWGMSDAVGPVAFRQSDDHPFLGKEIQEHREFSEETAHLIDLEIARILRDAQQRATEMLCERRSELDRLTEALLEKESVSHEELIAMFGPQVRNPVEPGETSPAADVSAAVAPVEPGTPAV